MQKGRTSENLSRVEYGNNLQSVLRDVHKSRPLLHQFTAITGGEPAIYWIQAVREICGFWAKTEYKIFGNRIARVEFDVFLAILSTKPNFERTFSEPKLKFCTSFFPRKGNLKTLDFIDMSNFFLHL